jgi:hypothetical protein
MMQPVLPREKLNYFLPKEDVAACSIQKRSYILSYLEKKMNRFLPKEVATCSIYSRKEVTAYKFNLSKGDVAVFSSERKCRSPFYLDEKLQPVLSSITSDSLLYLEGRLQSFLPE